MNIPEKAIEAAAEAMWKISPYGWRGIGDPPPFESAPPRAKEMHRKRSRAALEAAAPFIAAEAFRGGADDMDAFETYIVNAADLRARADSLEAPNA